ncbi:PARP10_14_15 [Mytilus coruscus]|uniref:PARP10_14_15 n=1 Tax=Mytilus coruscus TaxID=42192 RepID=A0A6J8CLT7_MYTCO|nr:PARP10_14_15 [Mytilus coruscus]
MLHKVLFICVFGMCCSFKLKCPDHSQWSLRARALCPSDPSKYSCIQNEHIKGYTEDCSVAEFERGGMKIILRGNLDAGPCSEERYQPGQMKYLTNVSSECIFSKSQCYEEGQMLYDRGSPTQDVKCRCDFTQNYDFICRQNASRYCKPSEEDCSCFKKQCLSTDYSCISTPPVATDPLPKTLRNEPVQPFIVQRNITKREKLNLSPCTAILITLIILAFPLSLLLCYDQKIDKLIDRQVRKAAQATGNQQHSGNTGSRPKSGYGKTKQATRTRNAGGLYHTVKLCYNYKQIKCMERSDFFKSRIPPGISVIIEGGTIELKGKDIQVVKLAKDNVEKCKESLKSTTLSIHSIQSQILKKTDVINFINEYLDIDNLVVTWDVVEDGDQALLIVFSFDKKEADEMVKKVMACIAEERVRIEETGLEWFQELLRNEKSKLTTTKSPAGDIIVYTTIAVRDKYFIVKRPSKVAVNLSSSVGQQHASNQLITGTDSIDPTKQSSTANQQATPRDNKHKDSNEMEEKQAHESKETKTKFVEELITLSFQQIKYINELLHKELRSICQRNVIEYNLVDNNIFLEGTSKNVAVVKKEINTLLEGYTIKSKQVYCGRPFVSDECRQNWKKMEIDKKCVIKAQQCKKPSIETGWVICSENPKMHIIYLNGPIWLADVDVILCPVTDQLFPVGTTTDSLKEGLDHTSLHRYFTVRDEKPGSKWGVGEVIPVYETGNLNCQCLYLCVQDQIKEGVVNDKAIESLAKRIIGNLQIHGYQSFGLAISYDDDNPALKTSSYSLASHLWKYSAGLKCPILLCCYYDREEEMDNFHDHLMKNVKIQDFLFKAILENFDMKGHMDVDINVMVHEGSILDFDSKVDVIVNSVGTDLNLQNGLVSKMLVDKAGSTIQVECDKQYKNGIDIGQIVVTKAGKLKCKNIFHIALYTRWVSTGNLSIEILKNLVTRCLEKAEQTESNSIIFPALGTGTLRYPPCLVAKTMFDAVYEFGRKRLPKHLQNVHFVLFEKEVVELFENVNNWKEQPKKEKTEFHVPPKHVMLVEKDLETRIIISDRNYYSGLHYKELRIVISEKDDCGVPLQKHVDILRNELRAHSDSIEQFNIKNTGMKKSLKVNYIKTVRLFVMSDEYCAFVNDIANSNKKKDGLGALYHISDKCAFPFLIEVIGQKKDTKEVMKIVKHDISPIEATMKFDIKIKQNQLKEAKKKLKKLKDSGPKFSLDEDSFSITCEGTKSQINKAKKELENFQELEVCLAMNEDDFTALLYITSEDHWRLHLRQSTYSKGKAIFQIEPSGNIEKLTHCIESELNNIHQLATSEVVPPQKFQDQFSTLQSEVEDVEQGIFCFLSLDKSKIIIKTSKYEQAQQAKYMVEVNLGMVQQGGGRRNRKFASPDEVGPGPVATSSSSSSELTIKWTFENGKCSKPLQEIVQVHYYSAGPIGNLKVDTLVNAANRDLMHGGGIAYHISNAAGYVLDKECDDYVQSNGPLSIGKCCSTTAGNLPYKSIIHAVGPMWHSYQHDRKQSCLYDLKMTILSALEML